MSYQLDKLEKDILKQFSKNQNLQPVLKRMDVFLDQNQPQTYINAFNKIHDVIQDSNDDVQKNLEAEKERRKQQGRTYDKKQASKSIVGNLFPSCIVYLFIQNKLIGNIEPNIFMISSKKVKLIDNFEEISTIKIGEEDTQKPDFDLVIFTQEDNNQQEDKKQHRKAKKIIIISVKTSMRERAGQTYKWKLLLEIATEQNSKIKDKYKITYEPKKPPLICFATVNFYNELNNPQQRGMLKFFDKAFLAKELPEMPSTFIDPLSTLVEFVNREMGQ